ncbi:MAG: L-rhamnose isomerase [Candidatus Latescibacteria bacterium]|nr:L-rhamnose isomerase [Candidatus Latescibacterota bacterium]
MQERYDLLVRTLEARRINVNEVKKKLTSYRVETPSWGYGNSGTRFKVFKQPGAARDVHERLADAAYVHKLTGMCPTVAIHIPWDKVDDYEALKGEARSLGITIGAVNPNVFQDDEYKLGSLTHVDPAVREKALDHIIECISIAEDVGSTILSLWFADGTNYPGQGDIRRRKRWMEESLSKVYDKLLPDMRMLIEYKFFEPGFYHTDIADWGMAYAFSRNLGPKAQVLVDLGHHPQGTNIEHVVAFLIAEGKLGGFHFNDRKYADDDLTTGSIHPYEVFLIFHEILAAEEDGLKPDIAYMIDQSHIIKPKLEAMIQTVMNIQIAYAHALLVDRKALRNAQESDDTVECERILQAAYQADVETLLAQVRTEKGLHPDPIIAHRKNGYYEKIIRDRASELKGAGSWG